jgi:hypothetical protein
VAKGIIYDVFLRPYPSGALHGVEKHFQYGSVELQIPPLRYAPVGMTLLVFYSDIDISFPNSTSLCSDDKGQGGVLRGIG